jgi:hypothetical protein
MSEFNNIMAELNQLLKEAEGSADDPNLVGERGSSVVYGGKGEVGSSTQAVKEKTPGDFSLHDPLKYGKPNSKELEYQDNARLVRHSDGAGKGDAHKNKKMLDEDADAKQAAVNANRLLNTIDDLLSSEIDKQASPSLESYLDTVALNKAGSYSAGDQFASDLINYLKKKAEEVGSGEDPRRNSENYVGDLADTARAPMLDDNDPHNVSDNASPEAEPSSEVNKVAPKAKLGDKQQDDLQGSAGDKAKMMEREASLVIRKAELMEEFEKAAYSRDPSELALVKAKIYDFVTGEIR